MTMATSMAMAMAGARSSLFEHHAFVRFLELPTASSSTSLSFLQSSSGSSLETINGVVTPDLPIKASLVEYFHSLELKDLFPSLRPKSATKEISEIEGPSAKQPPSGYLRGFNGWQVRTVAAQTRSLPVLRDRIMKASHDIEMEGCGGSLLLLSGGHPLRRVWFANELLPANSFAMLKLARQLRTSGLLSPGVQLWGVENPLINSVERFEKKINAGAEAIIVQPPLLPDRFAEWWSKAHYKGLMKAAPVIVGLPLLTSSRNYEFWIELTGASGKEADAMKARWRRVEAEHAGDSVAFARHCYDESVQLIDSIKKLPAKSELSLIIKFANHSKEVVSGGDLEGSLCMFGGVKRIYRSGWHSRNAGYTGWLEAIPEIGRRRQVVEVSENVSEKLLFLIDVNPSPIVRVPCS